MMPVKTSKQNHTHFKRNTYKTGLLAEWRARCFLRLHGFRILASRYTTGRYTGRAEIDIIARRGNLIIFVEVKSRKNLSAAWDAITPAQIMRLRSAAECYIARTHFRGNARFDVIIVTGLRHIWARGAI